MLFDLFLDFLAQAKALILQLISDLVPHPPGWVDQGPAFITVIMSKAAALDAWVPVTLAATVLVFIPVAILAGIAIKVARIFVSILTMGGGSAG